MLTDEQLVANAADGDKSAIAALYSRYNKRLIRQSCRQLHGDRQAAEDIAQATWNRVITRIGLFDPAVRPFAVWLNCIRFRLLLNWQRSQSPNGKRLFLVPDMTNVAAPRRKTKRAWLAELVDRLSPPLRDAIKITYLEDRSFPEAARLLGCSVGCVHKRTVKAIQLLRSQIGVRNASEVRRKFQPRRRSGYNVESLVA